MKLGLIVLAAVLAACTITVPVDINLSACMTACTKTSRECMDQVNLDLHTCVEDSHDAGDLLEQRAAQEQCVFTLSKRAENCSFAEIDCVTACIADAEKKLKGGK